MNSRKRRLSSRLAGNHQKSWLWGRHAVLETLRAGRWPVTDLFIDSSLLSPDITEVEQLANALDIPLQFDDSERLTELCQTYEHQGFLARMGDFPCENCESLLLTARTLAENSTQGPPVLPALFVVCDRIQDAHNFGAILRSCDAMKLNGIVIGVRYQ